MPSFLDVHPLWDHVLIFACLDIYKTKDDLMCCSFALALIAKWLPPLLVLALPPLAFGNEGPVYSTTGVGKLSQHKCGPPSPSIWPPENDQA